MTMAFCLWMSSKDRPKPPRLEHGVAAPAPGTDWIDLGPGLRIAERGDFSAAIPGYKATLKVQIDEFGTARCVSLKLEAIDEGGRVDWTVLQRIPMDEWLAQAKRDLLRLRLEQTDAELEHHVRSPWFSPTLLSPGPERDRMIAIAELKATGAARVGRSANRRPIDPAKLKLVAETFKAAPDHPVQAVMDTFGLPLTTANRWIRKARDANLLADTQRKRKGSDG